LYFSKNPVDCAGLITMALCCLARFRTAFLKNHPNQEILSDFLMGSSGFCPGLMPNWADANVKRMPGTTGFFYWLIRVTCSS